MLWWFQMERSAVCRDSWMAILIHYFSFNKPACYQLYSSICVEEIVRIMIFWVPFRGKRFYTHYPYKYHIRLSFLMLILKMRKRRPRDIRTHKKVAEPEFRSRSISFTKPSTMSTGERSFFIFIKENLYGVRGWILKNKQTPSFW